FSSHDYDSYGNDTVVDYDAAPCHNHFCPLFQRVAPPFLAATCAAAALGTAALLVALAKRPQAWRWPQSRALVAQLALGTALGIPCFPPGAKAGGRLWGAALISCPQSLAPFGAGGAEPGEGERRSHPGTPPGTRRLAVALWAAALLLATPAALVSGVAAGTGCVRRSVGILSPAYLLHLSLCLCLLLLLPAGLLLAALAVPRLRANWAAGAGLIWLFLGLWGPYGAGLAGEFLLQAGLLEPTCGSFEHFDLALGLSEALGVLHCGLGPLALLLAWRC
ncbi:ACKR1 protein, partial [Alaudala cheleensis]|nr:ACKR1 protein [Alaudala cheleensis]